MFKDSGFGVQKFQVSGRWLSVSGYYPFPASCQMQAARSQKQKLSKPIPENLRIEGISCL
jgi:hypothetical protein